MIVKRFLFCNLEHKTPAKKVENGYNKQGRGVLGLLLLAFFGVFFDGTAWGQTPITDLAGLNAMTTNGNYVITADIQDASGYTTKDSFTGTLAGQAKADGTFPVITGLTQPIFGTIDGGTVKNVMLKNVTINSTSYSADTVGAIACVAKGYTRIYNCGILPNTKDFLDGDHSSVEATNCAGSIVGSLRDDSRVVNCFSYADVS